MGDGRDSHISEVLALGEDIVSSARFAKAETVHHHSRGHNIARHSVDVAASALRMTRWLNRHGMAVSERDAVRAALLHDIGMTEDKVFNSISPVKSRMRPIEGERIAREEYGANKVQLDAIRHHMWPLCVVPPRSFVGWVVLAADKRCSMHEARDILRSALHARQKVRKGR